MASDPSVERMHESHAEAHDRVGSIGEFRAWIGGEAVDSGTTLETVDRYLPSRR